MRKSLGPMLGAAVIAGIAVAGMVAAGAESGGSQDPRANGVPTQLDQTTQNNGVPTQDQLPPCVAVGAGGVTRGCVHKADLTANPDEKDQILAESPLGLPVYASPESSQQVGYVTAAGFVPLDLASRYDEIVACNEAFSARIASGSALPASCHDLLLAQGADPALVASVEAGTAHRPPAPAR